MAICRAAAAASCSVNVTTRPDLPSRSTVPVPIVPVPKVWTYQGPHHSTTTSLPDALLFAFDSSVLIRTANSILQPLVARVQRHHLLVSITGHASPDGGTIAYNLALSKRRARAVRNRLIALGLPAAWITRVTGVGTDHHGPGSCLMQGQLDETICAHLRKVVIVMSPRRSQS